jgi:ribosomal protein S18 acetylase RimI-like enzyme
MIAPGYRRCVPISVSIATVDDTDEVTAALERLVPQLSRSNPPPTDGAVREMLAAPAITQFVARADDGGVVGVATLATFRIPTGLRAWIEDVITDEAARGQGIGELLTRAMIDRAGELGCTTVDLTSRPSREAANRLYQRVGFVPRETNVYRFDLSAEAPAPGA